MSNTTTDSLSDEIRQERLCQTIVAASLCNGWYGAGAWDSAGQEARQNWMKQAASFLDELRRHEWTVAPIEVVNE